MYWDTTIMIILAKFHINLEMYELQDIYYKCIMKVFEQSIVHYITKPQIFNGIIFSNSSEFKTIIHVLHNYFTMLYAYICGKCLLTLMHIF